MGRPLLVIPIRDAALLQHRDVILKLARQLGSGVIESIPVRLGCLSELVDQAQEVQLPPLQQKPVPCSEPAKPLLRDATDLRDLTAAEEQELDDTPIEQLSQRLWNSALLHEQAEVLELLQRRLGPQGIQRSPRVSRWPCAPCLRRCINGACVVKTGTWCGAVLAPWGWCIPSWKMP